MPHSPPSPKPNLNSVTTIASDGSRPFLHPADVRGRFTRIRKMVFIFLIAVYVLLPWIPINGAPAVFLDLSEGRFHLFGLTFLSQDFWLAFFLITGLGFLLFYVTAVAGRVWCGYACPQTVWLEGVFRRVERWIDGDPNRRRKLDAAPMSFAKISRRTIKHSIYILLALAISHVFISYFVSLPRLYEMTRQSPLENWTAFLWVFGIAGTLYFNFAWFREQTCIVLCPYGRLQSALIDDDSVVIGYDKKRGEPRGKVSALDAGDCVDCMRCVNVCPTGIDIRHGLQMECIGCAACVDACDDVMTRLNRPRGLIRYDSLNGLDGLKTKIIRPRIIVYTLFLIVGAVVMGFSLSNITPYTATVSRMQGPPYYVEDDTIRNYFQLRIINKQSEEATFQVSANPDNSAAALTGPGSSTSVGAGDETQVPLFITVPRENYDSRFPIVVTIEAENGRRTERTISFIGPDS